MLTRLVGPILLPLALGAGMFFQIVYPGDFEYVLRNPAPAWIAWFAVVGAVAALVVGFVRRRPALEIGAALASAAFLIAGDRRRPPRLDADRPSPSSRSSRPAWSSAVRATSAPGRSCTRIPRRASASPPLHPSTSPSAPPGHVADTEENRPYERARDARRFFRTGDLAIPRGYGADYVVVDGLRSDLGLDLPVAYQDERFTLYRL